MGSEIMEIRDDHVILTHRFFDQDGEQVKAMYSLETGEMGGWPVAIRQRMSKVGTPGEWTEVRIDNVEYDVEMNSNIFTQSSLGNPRE